ncbi:MAG: transcriptional repressor NrdR [Bacillota bacterium]|nr:transcriptional repressor NrdR [Bacillota bacterium]MDI6638321.1 transcriptional regulator NrdR [Bacillota bacterium]MDK2930107.1 transcriptional repressor NrdR [Bacillota bacterium]
MKCPYCGHPDSRVVDSRATDEGSAIRRRRECVSCERRFTTYEVVDEVPLMVVKKDGRREPFNRSKILTGLMKACQKRPVPMSVLEEITSDVERELRGRLEREVSSRDIGEMVIRRLRDLDKVAYVRFASVYREFKDIDTFMDELKKLLNEE